MKAIVFITLNYILYICCAGITKFAKPQSCFCDYWFFSEVLLLQQEFSKSDPGVRPQIRDINMPLRPMVLTWQKSFHKLPKVVVKKSVTPFRQGGTMAAI